MEPINFRNLPLRFCSPDDLYTDIAAGHTIRLATANPEFIEEASRNDRFAQILKDMSHVSVDGVGLSLALRLAGIQPSTRLTGVDFLHLALTGNLKGVNRIALIGSSEQVIQRMKKYPTVVFAQSGGTFDGENPQLSPQLLQAVIASKPDLLALGLGSPKQEYLLDSLRDAPIRILVGVGGSFDFISQSKSRSPKFFRKIGLEWLWRGIHEKGHIIRLWRAVVVFPIRTIFWLFSPSRKWPQKH